MGPVTGPELLGSEDVAWFRDDDALPGAVRGAAAALARRIGLDGQRASEVALAATEIATNIGRHAVDGSVLLRVLRSGGRAAVELVAMDSGPGIADVAAALRDGVSSAGTLGIGLGVVGRMADAFDLQSTPGRGTVLAARFWARDTSTGQAVLDAPADEPPVAGLTRPISGEQVCGDTWAAKLDPAVGADAAAGTGAGGAGDGRPAVLILLCDGLGHGPLAARAGEAAVHAFRESRAALPEAVLRDVHTALRGTRGGAVAVARIEPAAGRLLYCGVGNISGFLVRPDARSGLLSVPGIAGHQMRGLRTFEAALPPGSALVMHSDGLTERWGPGLPGGLLRHSPVVLAGHLLQQAGLRRDDAGIVVAKGLW
ncbi:ATP-binding protein/SpoIIE family protein phosphatase [Streptacidiphilus sp. ASG 303]|uniref:ATP-binding SpoIIE family protein phosphatase n=1 Tax=Streptacidiphilus sp. ASG 303 TaxID=2896847 RepID=UPI001E32EF6C|nr:ATP-binding SpoIIE family protein phosphatase [Streptacidiphilus sp. ASG 303]MCD0483695.1 ATP-binding protein/SpoIIE family protein phosphatase [Streptacidiphilus sp. ASG 303]